MRVFRTISREQVIQLQRALQRWEGVAVPGDVRSTNLLRTGRGNDVNSSASDRPSRPSL